MGFFFPCENCFFWNVCYWFWLLFNVSIQMVTCVWEMVTIVCYYVCLVVFLFLHKVFSGFHSLLAEEQRSFLVLISAFFHLQVKNHDFPWFPPFEQWSNLFKNINLDMQYIWWNLWFSAHCRLLEYWKPESKQSKCLSQWLPSYISSSPCSVPEAASIIFRRYSHCKWYMYFFLRISCIEYFHFLK